MYKCPYCAIQTLKSGNPFTSWRSVRNHSGQCERRTGDYFIDEVVGPIHYKDLEGLSREQVLFRFPGLKSTIAEIRKSFLRRDIVIDCYKNQRSEEKWLEPVHKFYLEHGRIPKKLEIAEGQSICRHFKTWNDAIRLAGYEPKPNSNGGQGRKSQYTDKYLLEQLQTFYREEGRLPKWNDFNKNPKYPGRQTYRRRFGSWNAALELAGLSQNSKGKAYTKQELLDVGKAWIAKHGCTPEARDFSGELPSRNTITKHFGSWNAYIVEIGGTLNKGSYGIPTQALDGNLYRSRLEARLADWLYTSQISYKYEMPYPLPYNRLYDFYLPIFDVYIELDGMGEARDRDVIAEKEKINNLLGRRLLVLYPEDLDTLTVEKLLLEAEPDKRAGLVLKTK